MSEVWPYIPSVPADCLVLQPEVPGSIGGSEKSRQTQERVFSSRPYQGSSTAHEETTHDVKVMLRGSQNHGHIDADVRVKQN
jgi:hypothetical protein